MCVSSMSPVSCLPASFYLEKWPLFHSFFLENGGTEVVDQFLRAETKKSLRGSPPPTTGGGLLSLEETMPSDAERERERERQFAAAGKWGG